MALDEHRIEAVSFDGLERTVVLPNATFARYVRTGHLVFLRQNTLNAVRLRSELTGGIR